MKRLYLVAAFFGLVLPYYFFIRFILEFGFDPPLLFAQLAANDISLFFAVDLVITAIIFLVWAYYETNRLKMKNWWVFLVCTLLVGPSFSLPLFLYTRHAAN